jgi:hypothetical protein
MGVKAGLKENTICWNCTKACTSGCSWSDGSFTPVEGWTAIPDVNGNGVESFLVKECPEFVQDADEERNAQDMDDQGVLDLVERLLEITRDDYIHSRGSEIPMIEKFIRGRGAARLHQINDPDTVLRVLREQRKTYWRSKLPLVKAGK